jgi:hypothetical protein
MKPGSTSLFAAAIAAGLVPFPHLRAQDASAPEEIEITVGADGTSVVREVRSAQIVAGESKLRLFDVSPRLLPETVAMRALSGPDLVELQQQTAWFEVLDVARALEKLGERPIKLFRYHPSDIEKLEGRLLFPPRVPGPDGPVALPLYLEQNDGKIRLLDGAEIELDALPPGDWNRFRLDWRIACRRADRYRFELVYLTRGLSWRADYLLRVAPDAATGDLSAVATIQNETGVSWRGARIALAEPEQLLPWNRRVDPAERSSGLLHPAADSATLDRASATQLSLGQARDVKLRASTAFVVDLSQPGERLPVLRRFELADLGARGFARALPAGMARVVFVDGKNRPFVAARPFAGSAVDDPISFLADPVPGVVASSAITLFPSPQRTTQVAVRFASERDDAVEIETICPLGIGDTVEQPSVAMDRSLRNAARFLVALPARGSATVEFNLIRP